MKAETGSCYGLLINYILCNKIVLDYKFMYILLIIFLSNTTNKS